MRLYLGLAYKSPYQIYLISSMTWLFPSTNKLQAFLANPCPLVDLLYPNLAVIFRPSLFYPHSQLNHLINSNSMDIYLIVCCILLIAIRFCILSAPLHFY
eukprot:NODE_152_length_16986_cov_0.478119.p17 type:complete len:100 gc:universal NODE_152_length_16986_cov_0.478119:13537-13238(-)